MKKVIAWVFGTIGYCTFWLWLTYITDKMAWYISYPVFFLSFIGIVASNVIVEECIYPRKDKRVGDESGV